MGIPDFSITETFSDIGVSVSFDVFVLGALFLGLFFFTHWFGKSRMISLILSLFVAIPLYINFPFLEKVLFFGDSGPGAVFSYGSVFFAITFLSSFLVRRAIGEDFSYGALPRFVESGILSVSALGLLLALGHNFIPFDPIYDFAPSIDRFFTGQTFFFYWLIAPLAGIFLATRG